MKAKKILAWIFGVVGAALAALTIFVCLYGQTAAPMLLVQPAGARERVQEMMDAICDGDYEKAGSLMYGQPSLGGVDVPEGAEQLLWKAFIDRLEYRLVGECYATHQGIAQDVEITKLDIDGMAQELSKRTQKLLNEKIVRAEDIRELYDEKNEFRQDLLSEVLTQAAQEIIREDAKVQKQQIPLHILYAENQWWILPETELLRTISGENGE